MHAQYSNLGCCTVWKVQGEVFGGGAAWCRPMLTTAKLSRVRRHVLIQALLGLVQLRSARVAFKHDGVGPP